MNELDKEKEIIEFNDEVISDNDVDCVSEETTNEEEQDNQENSEFVQLKQNYEEAQNKLIRAQADFDNFRKRTTSEKEELAKYVNGQLIKELLPACDNFERAIVSSKENNNFDSLLEGIEMVYRQIKDVLANEGLEEIESIGKPFNPEYHQAVMQVEYDGESGIVVEELQKGFTYKGKVIRPAMVKVSV